MCDVCSVRMCVCVGVWTIVWEFSYYVCVYLLGFVLFVFGVLFRLRIFILYMYHCHRVKTHLQ
jgi:hypothetical protein